MARPRTVAALLRAHLAHLPRAEERVATLLLQGEPLVGLEPVAELAHRAGTSAPTVLRLLTRLGFASYAEFQSAVKDEVSARLSSPVEMYPSRPGRGLIPVMLRQLSMCFQESLAQVHEADLDRAAAALGDPSTHVLLVGGRFSGFLAEYLAAHLELLRPHICVVAPDTQSRTLTLLDVSPDSVVVAFDYRRYQADTVQFGRVAAERGAQVVLFTDQYLSPLAASADPVFSTAVDTDSPFDVLTPAVALVETLIAGVIDLLGQQPRDRMAQYEAFAAEMSRGTGAGSPHIEGHR